MRCDKMRWMELGYYKIREIPNSSVRLGECFAPPAWNVPGSATSNTPFAPNIAFDTAITAESKIFSSKIIENWQI